MGVSAKMRNALRKKNLNNKKNNNGNDKNISETLMENGDTDEYCDKDTQTMYIPVIVDSGATRHCTHDDTYMNNKIKDDVTIILGNGKSVKAYSSGSIGPLENVLHVPHLRYFLFSISAYLSEPTNHRKTISFDETHMYIMEDDNVIATGTKDNNTGLYNLYITTNCKVEKKSRKSEVANITSINAATRSNKHKKRAYVLNATRKNNSKYKKNRFGNNAYAVSAMSAMSK